MDVDELDRDQVPKHSNDNLDDVIIVEPNIDTE